MNIVDLIVACVAVVGLWVAAVAAGDIAEQLVRIRVLIEDEIEREFYE